MHLNASSFMTTGEILSVSTLNEQVRFLLEQKIGMVFVEGEISNFSAPSSGHWYFSLKDSKAQIRCAMFYHRLKHLNFQPKNGMQVLAHGLVSLYENRGDYQLIIEKLESLGDGKLRFELERLMRKLSEEGLFDEGHKKPLPECPKCIGIITSATGAALRDILHVLKRRAANIPIIIYPTAVQGDAAALQIVDALCLANKARHCDVLIVARGGGSLEDLWPFNEEIVARAIYNSEIPIISGVGHEVDFTICDWVADVRAPTPSAAAELVSPDNAGILEYALQVERQLQNMMRQKILLHRQELAILQGQLQHPKAYWQQISQWVDYQEMHLKEMIQQQWTQKNQALQLLGAQLNNLNPLTILQRGYAIALDEKHHVLGSVKNFSSEQHFELQLQDGVVKAQVRALLKNT